MSKNTLDTQRKIIRAFIELYKTKPVKSIHVNEIAALAKINRSTFYEYYKDSFDLLDKIEDYLVAIVSKHVYFTPSDFRRQHIIEELAYRKHPETDTYIILLLQKNDSNLNYKLSQKLVDYIYDTYSLDQKDPITKCETAALCVYVIGFVRRWIELQDEINAFSSWQEAEATVLSSLNDGINDIVKKAKRRAASN
ncbi:MAG: TetR/AcrR family transcriptional regulator [Clostridiales bacterium]|nr:TetR/AcrR family transcriptional regulator [Clostridiales bacterium]